MFKLSKIEKAEIYLEKAFKNSQKAGRAKTIKLRNKREKKKILEKYKISIFSKNLKKDIDRIKNMLPSIDDLDDFYKELFETTINQEKFGKAIVSLSWLKTKLLKLENEYIKKIANEIKVNSIGNYKKEFYGRSSSIIKKISKHFIFLDEVRKKLRNFPTIKTNMFTICICGFPNVGKSTLLSKITTARPKIEPYAFTTKQLMLGYMGKKIQIIDTPGTFKDILVKMNWIEKQSYLAIKYLSDILIYIFDITETSGFNVNDQKILYTNLRKKFPKKKILIYLSKNDLLKKEEIDNFIKKYKLSLVFYDIESLKKELKKYE